MSTLDWFMVIALFGTLALYVLSGGADYGAGIWNIFVSRELKEQQRELITKAIQPIWEANHVWLILVVVILFSAFPPVYAYVCTTLNIPITLSLLGLVMRGTAFVSRKYDEQGPFLRHAWENVFSASSVITPFLYGTMIGAISAGNLVMPSDALWRSLFAPWLTPYCICLGGFTLAIFAMLAATYLTVDADGYEELQLSFRRRSLISHAAVGVLALLSVFFAMQGDVWIYDRIATLPWALAAGGVFIVLFLSAIASLWMKVYKVARLLAAGEALTILAGYALAQFPYLVPPRYTVENSIAPQPVLLLLDAALAVGAVLLFPSLFFLFQIFKGEGKHSTTGNKPLDDQEH